MTTTEIESYIESIEKNVLLYEEKNFDKRNDAIEFIEFQVLDPIEMLLQKSAQQDKLVSLKSRVEKIRCELNEIDSKLFQKIRENIRAKGLHGAAFKNMVSEYFDLKLGYKKEFEATGYDNLDIFINGLLPVKTIPEQAKPLEPEMVYYQKTPARIVFEMVEQSHFLEEDVFFDIGSGLGQVAILVNLLAGITTRGVEFEPAFCGYATRCAMELNLPNVSFTNIDARKADYSEGTVFFMFTPFKGKMSQEVLDILRKESLLRKIKIITYGPCTAAVEEQSWLRPAAPENENIYKAAFFTSG